MPFKLLSCIMGIFDFQFTIECQKIKDLGILVTGFFFHPPVFRSYLECSPALSQIDSGLYEEQHGGG